MPALHTRRKFLRTAILGGAATWTLPSFIERTFGALDQAAADSAVQGTTGKDGSILVIVQLAGGNDGLNTLVPYADDAYHRARPTLAIPQKNVLRLSDHMGLNPALERFSRLCKDGHATIVQGVGYPNPNRSHFRSSEIWQTASDADRVERHGWLGRYFDNCCQGCDPTVAVNLGQRAPQAFSAATPSGVSLRDPKKFHFDEDVEMQPETDGGSIGMLDGKVQSDLDTFEYIERVALDAQVASDRIAATIKKYRSRIRYPGSRLAQDLKLVAQLIGGGMPTRIYYVSQGGFDTHVNQASSHDRLLGQIDEALAAFVQDLKSQGNFDRVMLMTFSEFGRRVAENGGGGTDHGTAAPMFLAGGMLKPGLAGTMPSLTDLDQGDLRFTVDFRGVYATLLERWLQAPSDVVLGRKFPTLDFVV